jgi:hypothetical protein
LKIRAINGSGAKGDVMSASVVKQRIVMTEKALKEAGQEAVNNAIIDALKEIARTLEILESTGKSRESHE